MPIINNVTEAMSFVCDHMDGIAMTTVTIDMGFKHTVEMRCGNNSVRLYMPYTSKAITCHDWLSARRRIIRCFRELYAQPISWDDMKQKWESFCDKEA